MYTDALIAELKATPSWNYDTATAWANRNGLSPRSVISKIGALGLTYVAKTAKGQPKVKAAKGPSKAELVASVEAVIGLRLPSLDKMNISDLTLLLEKISV